MLHEYLPSGSLVGAATSAFTGLVVAAPSRPQAPCLSMPPETFFPDLYNLQYKDQIAEAKAACLRCPFQEDCLEEAVADPGRDGICGATTPRERRRIRVQRAKRTAA